MGTSAQEVVFNVTTRANLAALRQTQNEVTAVGRATLEAENQAAKAAETEAAAEQKRNVATAEGRRLRELFNQELAKTPGDYQAAARAAKDLLTQELGLAKATESLASATENAAAAQATLDAKYESARKAVQTVTADRAAASAAAVSGAGSGAVGKGLSGVPEVVKRTNEEVDKMNPKLRTAANSFAILAQSAATGSGSMAGLAVAVANVALGIRELTTVSKELQTTTVIGLVLTLGTAVYGFIDETLEGGKHLKESLKDVRAEIQGIGQQIDNNDTASKITQITRAAERETEQLEKQKTLLEKAGLYRKDIAALEDAINAKRDASIALAIKERDIRQGDLDRQQAGELQLANLENVRYKTQFELDRQRIALESVERQHTIDLLFAEKNLSKEQRERYEFLRDQEAALTEAQNERLRQQLNAEIRALDIERGHGGTSVKDRYEAEIKAIEDARQADIKRTGDSETATAIAEQKKRALMKATWEQSAADAGNFATVLTQSHSRTLKAIGTFAENYRKLVIGALAAESAVDAAKEGAASLAALATGDLPGAALHAASALQYAAAAAMGAQEALGGGRSASGAGGGGPGGGGTFTPNQQQSGGGDIHLTIQTIDPRSETVISETIYHINRSEVLKRPIYPPPQRRSA